MKKILIVLVAILSIANCQNNPKEFPVLKGPYLGQKTPGTIPVIFALGIVSMSETSEWSSSFSPDGKKFYFQRVIENEDDFQIKIYETKIINEKWTQPAEVSFTKGINAGAPHVTLDNNFLYFGWWKPNPEGDPDFIPGRVGRIWYVERTPIGWSEPRYAGQGMFTSSDKKGNVYTTDLSSRYINGRTYLAKTKLKNGQFNELEKQKLVPDFGEPVHPCISPDGKYLFFQLNGDLWWVSAKFIEDMRPKN